MAKTLRLAPRVVIAEGVTLDRPGLYQWAIAYADGSWRRYVGKFTRARRPTREYHLNVERLLDGHPYRRLKPTGFRLIHRELALAVSEGREIVLTILENVDPKDLARRERETIRTVGATLNGDVAAPAIVL